MSTIRNPVGPQPANIYWRRRLLVLGGLLLVIVVILLIVFSPKGEQAPSGASSSAPPSGSAQTDSGKSDEPVACDPSVITVTPVTDASSYPDGVNPMISMTITNNGAVACTINAGTDAQLYSIVSGPDPIWNSKDCQTDSTPAEVVLEPGAAGAKSTTPFSWDRTRSSTSTCDTQRPAVTANGATYRLSVSLGAIESSTDVPFVLN